MGIRLCCPPTDQLAKSLADRVIVTDYEGSLWPCQTRWGIDNDLVVQIETDESCYVSVPWCMADGSERMLSTATLVQGETRYMLTLELARGTLHRVLNEVAAWEQGGNDVPESLQVVRSKALSAFSKAATLQHPHPAGWEAAERALQAAIGWQQEISHYIARQLLDSLTQNERSTEPLFGLVMPETWNEATDEQRFKRAFDSAVVPCRWRDTEREPGELDFTATERQLARCQRLAARTIIGPLLQFHGLGTPDWLYLWEGEQDEVAAHAEAYVERVARRFAGRAQLWYASSGLNKSRQLGLTEEHRLRLAARSSEIIRKVDPQTPIMIGFEQPWGEYLARSQDDLTPHGFADVLVRSQIGVAALALELNFDVWPDGTTRRDVFSFLRHLDDWSRFQLPLVVAISVPSGFSVGDANAPMVTHRQPNVEEQGEFVNELVELLQLHSAVQGILWNQWSDADASLYPKSGLVDEENRGKPALETWTRHFRSRSAPTAGEM